MFCYKDYIRLPENFNLMINHLRIHRPQPHYNLEKALYHYSSFVKPSFNTDDVFNKLYFEYFLKTPWATAEMFGNIDKVLKNIFRQTVNNSKDILLHMTNLLTRRQRAFFVEKDNLDAVKNIFAVKNDEFIIDASELDADKKLIDELNKSNGEKIFFMFIGNYGQAAQILAAQNFVEGVDFINAMMFLSERYGFTTNFDTKPIVQVM